MITYLVGWSGGYDPPSYKAVATEEAAMNLAKKWLSEEATTDDMVEVLRIDAAAHSAERISIEWKQ